MPPRQPLRPIAHAVALFAAVLGPLGATAQTNAPAPAPAPAPTPAPAAEDGLKLDRIVITGTSTARSKMKQSVSVSTLDAEQIDTAAAASATELLRAVPGVRAEASGGESNANLGVRGLPMSDGGGRYVQLQEDGLPVILVGDISFGTADQFLRADYSLDSIDVIRGGSSSTLATNAPGAVINFRTKTGAQAGGAVGFSLGLDHRQQRIDYAWGGKIGSDLTYHLGGFHRIGEGPRNSDVTLENGGQFRASIGKALGGGSSLRLIFKHLDDRTPTYLPVPVVANGSKISTIAGVDPRSAFFVSSNFPTDVVVDRNGNTLQTRPADGVHVKVTSLGLEADFKLGNGLSITNRMRKSAISGHWIGVFPAGSQPVDYTGATPVFSAHIFNTALDDFGNFFNDLRVQKEIKLAGSDRLTLTGGLFSGTQRIAQTWYWNRYNVELKGTGARLFDNAGNVSFNPVADATTTWGGCCFRSFDVDLTAVAPFAALTWDSGALSLDASLRHDRQRASGWQKFGDAASGNNWNAARRNKVSYDTEATSGSVGVNVEASRNLAWFARASRGYSWKSPDRVIWDTRVATGLDPYPRNEVTQLEGGVKFRSPGLSAFVTAFFAKTKEGAGIEITTRELLADSYDSKGLEAELVWSLGDLRIAGGATLTDAQVTSGPNKGNTPRRQAKLIYQLSPSYRLGTLEFGGALIGTTGRPAQNDNVVQMPGFFTVNAYAAWELAANTQLTLSVNNLFDKLGYTEAEGQNNLGNNPLYIARSVNGRSAKVALKYSF